MNNKEIKEIFLFNFIYLFAFILLIYFRYSDIAITTILIITSIIILYRYNIYLYWIIILTILFTTIENICVYYGLWKYNSKYLFPFVPIWLYFAWMLSIIFIVKSYNYIYKNYKK